MPSLVLFVAKSDPRRPPNDESASLWESTLHVLTRAQDGDRTALGVLLERVTPPLRRWARNRIPSNARGAEDTEDLVHNALLRTLKRKEAFDLRSVGSLQAYLRNTVMNSVRDIARRVRRRGVPIEPPEDLSEDAPSPLELAIRKQSTARFVDALQTLKQRDRQAVVLRIELGYSYADIAEQLGKPSAAAARMSVTRAMNRLAAELGIKA